MITGPVTILMVAIISAVASKIEILMNWFINYYLTPRETKV